LHVGWLIAQGQRLYRDFAEDHAPFLFVILSWLLPERGTPSMPLLDVLTYLARARAVMVACGLVTLASAGAIVYRATRSVFASLVTAGTLAGSYWVWHEALTRVRNDPPALALFWLGVALLLARSERPLNRHLLAGAGLGLTVAAALWNPKMPVECLVVGAVYLWKLKDAYRGGGIRHLAAAVAPAIVIIAVAVACIASVTSLGDYVFFTFTYNVFIADVLAERGLRDGLKPFEHCDAAFKGVWPLLAIAVASLILFVRKVRSRIRSLDFAIYAFVYAIVLAAAIDIRFIFSYPDLAPQYYLMWAIALATLYGMTAAAALEFVRNEQWTARLQVTTAIVVTVGVIAVMVWKAASSPSWVPIKYMQKRLRPGETVLVSAELHPIAAYDASYYWFVFDVIVPAAMRHTERDASSPLPRVRPEDSPICRAERGLEPRLRFVSEAAVDVLPQTRRCFDRMRAAGRVVRTPVWSVWDLRPEPSRTR